MSGKRYTDEFKIEAGRQVTDRGYSVVDVAERLGVTTHSLYAWLLNTRPRKRFDFQTPQELFDQATADYLNHVALDS